MMLGMENFMHRPDMREYGYFPGQVPPMGGAGAYGQPGHGMPQPFPHNMMQLYPAAMTAQQSHAHLYAQQQGSQDIKPQGFAGEFPPLSIKTDCPTNPDDDPPPITPPPQRERFSYTRYQIELLNGIFDKVRYPNSLQKQLIAKRVGITRDQVKIWFQNRRRKDVVGAKSTTTKSTESSPPHRSDPKMVPDHILSSVITELVRYENDPKGKKLRARLAAKEMRPKPYDVSARPGQLKSPSPRNLKVQASTDLSYVLPEACLPCPMRSSDGGSGYPVSPGSEGGNDSSHSSSLNSSVPSPQNSGSPQAAGSPDLTPSLNPLDMPAPPNAVAPLSANMDDVRKKLMSITDSPPCSVNKNIPTANLSPISSSSSPGSAIQPLCVTIPGVALKDPRYSPLSSDEGASQPPTIPTTTSTQVSLPAWSSTTSNSTSPSDYTHFQSNNQYSHLTSKAAQYGTYKQPQHHLQTIEIIPQTTTPSTVQMQSSAMPSYPKYSNPQMRANLMSMQHSYNQMADVKPLSTDGVYPFSLGTEPTVRFDAMSAMYPSDSFPTGFNPSGVATVGRDAYQPVSMSSYYNPYYGYENAPWADASTEKDKNFTVL